MKNNKICEMLGIKYPIFQGAMAWVSGGELAGAVSRDGGLGIIAGGGMEPELLRENIRKAKAITTNPFGVNLMLLRPDVEEQMNVCIEEGVKVITTGAGNPGAFMEKLKAANIKVIPVIPTVKLAERMEKIGADAVIVEGPKSGGHQGAKAEDLFLPEHQLESVVPEVKEERDKWGDFPIIAAGGIWDNDDIQKIMALGADAVQLGTRFIGTYECDASEEFKNILVNAEKEDIVIVKSPVGYPGRSIKTNLIKNLRADDQTIKCYSNCIAPCNLGEGARKVGFCIANCLGDSYNGKVDTGLFFSGENGYRIEKLVSVEDLINELMTSTKNTILAKVNSENIIENTVNF